MDTSLPQGPSADDQTVFASSTVAGTGQPTVASKEERETDAAFMLAALALVLVLCCFLVMLYFCYKCVARLCLISRTPTKITARHCFESLCTFDCCLRAARTYIYHEEDPDDPLSLPSAMATKESEVPLRLQDQSTLVPLDLKGSSMHASDNEQIPLS